jgi:hypothetical protein
VQSGQFFGTNIENTNRGYQLPGTSGDPKQHASATIQIVGLADLYRTMAALPGVAKRALGHAMRVEMEGIIQLARDQYVPVDTGRLRKSLKAKGPQFISSTVIEVIGQAGPVRNPRGSMYAIPVHEIPEPPSTSVGGRSAHHQWGTWKYLQIPFLIRQNGMQQRIAAETMLMIGRLGLVK